MSFDFPDFSPDRFCTLANAVAGAPSTLPSLPSGRVGKDGESLAHLSDIGLSSLPRGVPPTHLSWEDVSRPGRASLKTSPLGFLEHEGCLLVISWSLMAMEVNPEAGLPAP